VQLNIGVLMRRSSMGFFGKIVATSVARLEKRGR